MMNVSYRDLATTTGSVGDIFRLIRSGTATSRSEIARMTGLSPSTVGLRVESLQRLNLVTEEGEQLSRTGRRARVLRVLAEAGYVVGIELGIRYMRLALADLRGAVLLRAKLPGLTDQSPQEAVDTIWHEIQALLSEVEGATGKLKGVAIGLPAPIEYSTGRVVSSAFMPSWHNASLPKLFEAVTDVPVLVENDANLAAIAYMSDPPAERGDHLLAVLLGTRIGSGIVADGRLLRGFNGAAGELSHTAVSTPAAIPCACGLESCLEAVASGAAIGARLRSLGHDVENLSDIVALGRGRDPQVVAVLRDAGSQVGTVLASTVNFFNPRRVLLAGQLSESTPFVAAIRAELFQKCLPIAAQDLDVSAVEEPEYVETRGALRLLLDEVFAPARIDERARVDDLPVSS